MLIGNVYLRCALLLLPTREPFDLHIMMCWMRSHKVNPSRSAAQCTHSKARRVVAATLGVLFMSAVFITSGCESGFVQRVVADTGAFGRGAGVTKVLRFGCFAAGANASSSSSPSQARRQLGMPPVCGLDSGGAGFYHDTMAYNCI